MKRLNSAGCKELGEATTDETLTESLQDEGFSVASDPTGEFLQVSSNQDACEYQYF